MDRHFSSGIERARIINLVQEYTLTIHIDYSEMTLKGQLTQLTALNLQNSTGKADSKDNKRRIL